jgi:NAD(P)-dependent dehydrogenase (short-subunit alcohol dehydrogenase family)
MEVQSATRRLSGQSLGIVITGGTGGLGRAMAGEFLRAGDRVVICGRNPSRLESALRLLQDSVADGDMHGMVCDVSMPADAEAFAAFAVSKLGVIDRWINNAGTSGRSRRQLWELDAGDLDETCRTNLNGSMMMCSEAIRAMCHQPSDDSRRPSYHIFNMGFSAGGVRFSPTAVHHRASKRAVALMTDFIHEELKRSHINSIGIHELSPGLVLTDLLLHGATQDQLMFFNAVAETPETVAAALVPRIRSVRGSGRTLRFRPVLFMLARVLLSRIGFGNDRFFDRVGRRMPRPRD